MSKMYDSFYAIKILSRTVLVLCLSDMFSKLEWTSWTTLKIDFEIVFDNLLHRLVERTYTSFDCIHWYTYYLQRLYTLHDKILRINELTLFPFKIPFVSIIRYIRSPFWCRLERFSYSDGKWPRHLVKTNLKTCLVTRNCIQVTYENR